MECINKFPSWLRVFLLGPVAFLAFFIVYFLTKSGISFFWAVGGYVEHGQFVFDNFDNFIAEVVASGLSAYAFVWIGAKIAPKYNFVISIVLGGFIVCMLFLSFYLKFFLEDRSTISWPLLIGSTLAVIFGSIRAAMIVREEFKF